MKRFARSRKDDYDYEIRLLLSKERMEGILLSYNAIFVLKFKKQKTKQKKVGLVCADTFRAGAFAQLKQNCIKSKLAFYGRHVFVFRVFDCVHMK